MTRIENFASKASYATGVKTAAEREIEGLIKQKNSINEQIAEIKADEKLNDDLKKLRVETLTAQLQTIETQIAQKRMEQIEKRKESTSPNKQQQANETSKDQASTSTMEQIIGVGSLYNNLGQLTGVRTKLEAESTRLKGEVRLGRFNYTGMEATEAAESRNEMKENAERTVFKKKTENAAELDAKVASIDRKIGKTMESIQEAIQGKEDKSTEQSNQEGTPNVGGNTQAAGVNGRDLSTKENRNNGNRQEQKPAQQNIDVRV